MLKHFEDNNDVLLETIVLDIFKDTKETKKPRNNDPKIGSHFIN